MRALLVEDDSATAKSVDLMLQGQGIEVFETDLGEEGLDLGKFYTYDVIILDLNLPDMHGYEMLRRLRAAHVKTPVIILSAMAEPDDKLKGLGFGADDYITKPFERGDLIARIRALVPPVNAYPASRAMGGTTMATVGGMAPVAGSRLHLARTDMLEFLSLW
ncbi:MAG: response regulator [Alphaproteobacteria bacterium]|jgi:two-component system cell cycle response regulator CtrA|nr:response regulator [Alphaproteobacteria bacterium]